MSAVTRVWCRRPVAFPAAALIVVLLSGCGSPEGSAEPVPELSTPAAGSPPASPRPTAPEPIEFAFRAPERPCPPVSALASLPPVPDDAYALVNAHLEERADHTLEICTYALERVDAAEADLELADHGVVGGNTRLYRDIADSPRSDRVYPELPVASDDLDDWMPFAGSERPRVWQDGCGRPMAPCAEGEEPTVRTNAVRTYLNGRVGNLEFHIRAVYVAEHLPADAERRNTAVLREFVLASMAYREPVD